MGHPLLAWTHGRRTSPPSWGLFLQMCPEKNRHVCGETSRLVRWETRNPDKEINTLERILLATSGERVTLKGVQPVTYATRTPNSL